MPRTYNSAIGGQIAVRMLKTIVAQKASAQDPDAFIDRQGWVDGELVRSSLYIAAKSAVGASDGSDMLQHSPANDDYAAALREITVFDRLQGRKVPLLVRLFDGDGAVGYWVEESKPIPFSRSTITGSALDRRKVGAMCLVPNELLNDPSAEGEERFAADLVNAGAAAIDGALLDPTNAGSASKPAAITSDATPLVSTGATLANIDSDLKLMLKELTDAGSNLLNAKWILSPRTAIYLSMARGTGGALAYPNVTAAGGTLAGLPVIVSGNVPNGGSPFETSIILVDTDNFVYADEGVQVDLSSQATVEMSDAPTGATDTPVAASSYLVSLFQEECTAIRIVRRCSWKMRKPTVALLTDVAY